MTQIIPFPRRKSLVEGRRWDLEWARLKNNLRLARKWWLRSRSSYQPFFVIATCRSGSNLLLSYLHQDSSIAALSEVLCPQLAIGPSRYAVSPSRAIKHIRQSLHAEKAPVRGAKLMLHQLESCHLSIDHVHAAFPEARYIVLYRQSLAEQFVSIKTAHATKQFLVMSGQERKQAQIKIDTTELRNYCDHLRASYREAISHKCLAGRSMLLSYEELIADPAYWLSKHICPLIGAQPLPPRTYLEKQNTRPLAQQIINYQQVATLLHSPLCRQHHAFPWDRQSHRGHNHLNPRNRAAA